MVCHWTLLGRCADRKGSGGLGLHTQGGVFELHYKRPKNRACGQPLTVLSAQCLAALVMFIVETNSAKAAKKMSILMGIAFALTASFGPLLTMHIYVKPSPPAQSGLFGFPRRAPVQRTRSWPHLNNGSSENEGAAINMAPLETNVGNQKDKDAARTLAMREKGHRLGIFITIVAALVLLFGLGAESGLLIGLGFMGVLFGYLLARLWVWFRSA